MHHDFNATNSRGTIYSKFRQDEDERKQCYKRARMASGENECRQRLCPCKFLAQDQEPDREVIDHAYPHQLLFLLRTFHTPGS